MLRAQHFSKTLNRFLETLPIRRQAAESADTGGERVLLQHSHLLRSRLPEAHRRRVLVSYDILGFISHPFSQYYSWFGALEQTQYVNYPQMTRPPCSNGI